MKTVLRLSFLILLNCFWLSSFALPAGNYTATCRQCDMTADGSLTCQCPDHFQYWNSSTIYNANKCQSISNVDGNLLCGTFKGFHYYETAIYTPYQQTCHSCATYGNTLSCMCLRPNLTFQYTVLSNTNTCQAIYNQDGKLMCPPVKVKF